MKRSRSYSAVSARQRHGLFHWLEHQACASGDMVRIVLSRPGSAPEVVAFHVWLHQVPAVLGAAHRRQSELAKSGR